MKFEDIQRIFQTNLIAPTYLISKSIPYMKSQHWGRIINIGSISGVMGEAYASIYSSSKAGLIGLTKALALELAEYEITVNTINPGWVETELGNNSIEESEFSKDEILDCIPQKRFVKPEEIAKLCKYLISQDAKGITGQSINLCAGLSVGI
jgi:NAD(P)-dependent dehydrogenase (short-subunit alcohol dehydrogenase family)